MGERILITEVWLGDPQFDQGNSLIMTILAILGHQLQLVPMPTCPLSLQRCLTMASWAFLMEAPWTTWR